MFLKQVTLSCAWCGAGTGHRSRRAAAMSDVFRIAPGTTHLDYKILDTEVEEGVFKCKVCNSRMHEVGMSVCGHMFCLKCFDRLERDQK